MIERPSRRPFSRYLGCVLAFAVAATGAGAEEETTPAVDPTFLELIRATESIRGLAFEGPVPFERMSREELVDLVQTEFERQYSEEDWRSIEACYGLLGAIPLDLQLDRFLFRMLSEQVAGLYDPREKSLFVVGNLPLQVGLTQIILEHELTHALTDRHFDLLSLPIEDTSNDDRALAALALVEGDATVSMVEYAKDLGVGSALMTIAISLFMDQESFNAAPPFYQAWLTFPYIGGETFLLGLMTRYKVNEDGSGLAKRDYGWGRGRENRLNWKVADFLYQNPPASTEQVLHPEKLISGDDPPLEVGLDERTRNAFGETWKVVWENTLGEFLIRTLLMGAVSPVKGLKAAEDWGGDRYFLAEDESGRQLFYWRTLWDSKEAADRFRRVCVEMAANNKFGGVAQVGASSENFPRETVLWIASEEDLSHAQNTGIIE